jgi:hypothetical protein
VEELSVGRRVPWLLLPLVGGVVAFAFVPVIGDYEPWTIGDIPRSALVIAGLAALPAAIMLAALRTRWAWTAGVVALTALCVAAPLAVGIGDESSTAGIALLWIPFGSCLAAIVVVIADAVRSRSRGPGPLVRR